MMKETVLSRSIRLVFSGGVAIGLGLLAQPVLAQEANKDAQVQRVEITGSAIKRIQQEGAVPVQTLTKEDIAKTGAQSVTDLIQALPTMQGFVPASSSVNGGGGGGTTAALHSLPSKYTVVLLDGMRVAPQGVGSVQGGGFAVNLESIPLDAVERVEILTDGASALYGSDAIAGVVNFILKKNKTDGDVSATFNSPQHPGGGSWNAALSKGFGDLDKDRYNVLLSYSHDSQQKLQATDRAFSANGAYFPFSWQGTNYLFNQRTSNTEPANITFQARPKGSTGAYTTYSINPYYRANGNCGSSFAGVITDPAVLKAVGESCRFNYAATVQDIPSSTRDSGLIKGTFKLNDDTTLWSELVLSSFSMKAQYAPGAQPMGLNATSRLPVLYNKYVTTFLDANNLEGKGSANLGYRAVGNGGRADEYKTDAQHFVLGATGTMAGWDYNANLTLSRNTFTDTAAGGYTDFDQLAAKIADGSYDPVLGTGVASIAPYILNSQFSKTVSTLNTLHVGAQHDLFSLPGGTSVLAVGAEYSTFHYKTSYSDLILSQSGFSTQPDSADYPVGGNYGQVPFDASRDNWGVFGEMLFPVMKNLDVTAALRYDSYSKTHSKYVFSTAVDPVSGLQNQLPDADLGEKFSATTGKVSMRFTPVENVLLRASYGTGFKAPNISDIAGASTFAGSTAGSYPCPFPGSAGCLPGSAQYDLVSGPNGLSGDSGLKPEKSKQWTLGFRVDPMKGLSLGMDLWHVRITNQVVSQGIAEQVAFANPTTYQKLFLNPYADPAGYTTIAYQQVPFNGGEAEYKGVDWDFSYKTKTDFGNLAVGWNGTYMLKQQYNDAPGAEFHTDLGVFGPDQQVVFRTITNVTMSLQTGAFTNTLTAHYKSGYQDEAYPIGTDIFLRNPDGSQGASVDFPGIRVPSYTTFDWQTKWAYNKQLTATFGIKNVFDRNPPFTLQNGGGGNQIGYDGRYADPIGRQFYLSANYKF
jgi:iron complex outermembrane recepter protein